VLVVGDFNATYWHPPFRRLTGDGLTDAHVVHGRGLSVSWPTDLVIPPFVRLDHVLTGNGLIPTEIVDFDVPGSDHRGFVVTVVPADRGGPGTPAPGER
jgi:endonuclease/exonuclease/phosphatase (EEP) superfamily protein YafD